MAESSMIQRKLRSVFDCLLYCTFGGICSITICVRQNGDCNPCQLEQP